MERCIHRHTKFTHPNCFRKGLVKKEDWWKDLTIGYLDIETSDLKANWGIMLSWALKYRGKDKVAYDIIRKKEIFDFDFDKRIVQSLLDELKNVDLIVTYNGIRFDVPYLRTRADKFGLEFPKFGSLYHWDLYYKVKRSYATHRKSLAVITKFLGIDGKTPVEPEDWVLARYGDKDALAYVLEHNIEDVKILEMLHDRLWRYSKWTKTSI